MEPTNFRTDQHGLNRIHRGQMVSNGDAPVPLRKNASEWNVLAEEVSTGFDFAHKPSQKRQNLEPFRPEPIESIRGSQPKESLPDKQQMTHTPATVTRKERECHVSHAVNRSTQEESRHETPRKGNIRADKRGKMSGEGEKEFKGRYSQSPGFKYIHSKYGAKFDDLGKAVQENWGEMGSADQLIFSNLKNVEETSRILEKVVRGDWRGELVKEKKRRKQGKRLGRSRKTSRKRRKSEQKSRSSKRKSPQKAHETIELVQRTKSSHLKLSEFQSKKSKCSNILNFQSKQEFPEKVEFGDAFCKNPIGKNLTEFQKKDIHRLEIGPQNIFKFREFTKHAIDIENESKTRSMCALNQAKLAEEPEKIVKEEIQKKGIKRLNGLFNEKMNQGKIGKRAHLKGKQSKSGKIVKKIKKVKTKTDKRTRSGRRKLTRKRCTDKKKQEGRIKFPKHSEVANYISRIPMLNWEDIDPYHEQRLKSKQL